MDHNVDKNNSYVEMLNKKDDNIHKIEALKWENKQTLTLVECQN